MLIPPDGGFLKYGDQCINEFQVQWNVAREKKKPSYPTGCPLVLVELRFPKKGVPIGMGVFYQVEI